MREALAKAGVCTSLSFDQFIQERNAVPAISAFMEKTRLLGQFHAVNHDAIGFKPNPEAEQPEQEQPV
ncbi:hypothetical protein N7513_000007 [Penicillium frequentans]|nr:hypothetical protein N7513_000007 [Penicillium glabrum]